MDDLIEDMAQALDAVRWSGVVRRVRTGSMRSWQSCRRPRGGDWLDDEMVALREAA